MQLRSIQVRRHNPNQGLVMDEVFVGQKIRCTIIMAAERELIPRAIRKDHKFDVFLSI